MESKMELMKTMLSLDSIEQPRVTINNIKQRLIRLSPTVKAGLERECTKDDFVRDIEAPIGVGSFAEVFKVTHITSGKTYAIKVLDKSQLIERKNVDLIRREIDIMYKLNHPNIMKLVNHFEDDNKIYLILPYAAKGQLFQHLRRQGRFEERVASRCVLETIDAVHYLQSLSPKIVHRDIKPENLLLDENFKIKLTDFSIANYQSDKGQLTSICGSSEYMAPEIIKGQPYDYTCDIWAIGVLLYELLAGFTPFCGSNQEKLISNIKKLKINWPSDFPPLAKNLISKILKLNPRDRISLDEIKDHAWFRQNCSFKPNFYIKELTQKERIESHLINASPDSVQSDIDNYLEPEKPSLFGSKPKRRKNFFKSFSNQSLKTMSSTRSKGVMFTRFAEKTEEIVEFQSQLDDNIIEISHLKDENVKKVKRIEELEVKVVNMQEDIEKGEITLKEKDNIISSLEEQVSQKEKIISQLKGIEIENTFKISSLKSKNESLQRENDSLSEQVEKLLAMVQEISKQKEELRQKYEVEVIIQKASQGQKKTVSIGAMFDVLSKTFREFKQSFNEQANALDERICKIKKSQKEEIEQQSDLIIKSISKANEMFLAYKNEIVNSFEQMREKLIHQEIKSKEKEIASLKLKNEELQLENAKRLMEVDELGNLKDEVKLLQKEVDLLRSQLAAEVEVVELKKERKKDYERKFMELRYEIQNLQDFLPQLENRREFDELRRIIIRFVKIQ